MLLIKLISFISLRSEDTITPKPKRTLYSAKRSYSRLDFYTHVKEFFVSLISAQALSIKLIIAGIERNPGPGQANTCKSCCTTCSTKDQLECSICFRTYHIQCVSKLSTCANVIKDLLMVRGKLIYVCELCCNDYDDMDVTQNFDNFSELSNNGKTVNKTAVNTSTDESGTSPNDQSGVIHEETKSRQDKSIQWTRLRTIANQSDRKYMGCDYRLSNDAQSKITVIQKHRHKRTDENNCHKISNELSTLTILPKHRHIRTVKSILAINAKNKYNGEIGHPTILPNKVQPLLSIILRPPDSSIFLKWMKLLRDDTDLSYERHASYSYCKCAKKSRPCWGTNSAAPL